MTGLRTASIRTQIGVLATLLVILVAVVATAAEPYIYGRHERGAAIGLLAGRIEMISDRFRRASSPSEEQQALDDAGRLGLVVTLELPNARSAAAISADVDDAAEIADRVRKLLDGNIPEQVARLIDDRVHADVVAIPVDAERILLFQMPVFPWYIWLFPAIASGLLKIVVPLVVLAYFSSWLITRPLERFTSAAKRLSMDDSQIEPFFADGSAEIRSLAASLNTMRSRVQAMIDGRTLMLSAVSHDLRTPLTRLRMRADLCEQPDLRQRMLADIEVIGAMIDESLQFLTNFSHIVPEEKIDLSSLLQTIATDFTATGLDVRFDGPRRLTTMCKPQAITRAIANLVENASRFGTCVDLTMVANADGGIVICVADDGPGLSSGMKEKVLQPFFKEDTARTARSGTGFGLGLPIAHGIITKGHRGTFRLMDGQPSGLVVEITLPGIVTDG